MLLVPISVGLLYFIVSSAMTAYYKQQLGFICTQSATYAAGRPTSTAQSDTTAFVVSMEQQMNMGTGSPVVTVVQSTINGAPAKSVAVKDRFPVLGLGAGLWNVSLQAAAVAASTASSGNGGSPAGVTGWYSLYETDAYGNPQSFNGYIPVYGSLPAGFGIAGRMYAWPPAGPISVQ
jgi:hypothetical protein